MIPKIIHYCWISGEENMPDDIKACIASWHEYLPDYEFINWNDSNFNWNICEFTKYCRERNMYAFCSDYIRFWAIYNYGGIYLDTDVRVYNSFNKLLKLNRIVTCEILGINTNSLEAAILGGNKGDEAFGKIINWYNNLSSINWSNNWGDNIIAPKVISYNWNDNYNFKYIKDLRQVSTKEDMINILDYTRWFRADSPECIAQHQFKGSWCKTDTKECYTVNDFKIFVVAHKPIENYIPHDKRYVILDTTGKADNTINDNYHEKIDISNDDFVKDHNVSYSEGSAMYWLWKHPDVIPDYIVFNHYRRMFLDFSENSRELFITRRIDSHGAIIAKPFYMKSNKQAFDAEHPKEDNDVFIESIKEVIPEHYNTFISMMNDSLRYACNISGMKKEHFLEMCEMCFKVLARFDEKQNYKNNTDIVRIMIKRNHTQHLRCGISWQKRLQGFYLEWLTDLYYRYKFGVENCYTANVGIPKETHSIYEQ